MSLASVYLTRSSAYSSNVYADVASRWDCQEYYGYDKWFGGHRDGATGLADPYTQDITSELPVDSPIMVSKAHKLIGNIDYKNAVEWIQEQIESNDQYQTDDTRFWVDVPAI